MTKLDRESSQQRSEDTELKMKNLIGIYIVLIVGSGLAFIYGISSWICYILRKSKNYGVPVKEVLIEELKFALDFNSHTRILKNTVSIYSHKRNDSFTIASETEIKQ